MSITLDDSFESLIFCNIESEFSSRREGFCPASTIAPNKVNAVSPFVSASTESTLSAVIHVPCGKHEKNLEHSDFKLSVLFSTNSSINSAASSSIE